MATDPKKPADAKPKKPRAKIGFLEAIRRVEIAMRDLTPELALKLAEYASLAAKERQPATPI